VSKKARKLKKKISNVTESENKPAGDNSCIQKEAGVSIDNQLAENQLLQKESLPNAISTEQEDVPDDNDHQNLEKDVNSQVCLESMENANLDDNGHGNVKEDVNSEFVVESVKNTNLDDNEHENVEEDVNSQVGSEPMKKTNPEHPNDDMLDDTGDFSEDEQINATSEVDFNVSTLVSAFANHSIIQKLCWLLKFYKSNSLAINHYIISMLRRISDELELHPMLYQVWSLKHFTFNEIV
jgi:timeless